MNRDQPILVAIDQDDELDLLERAIDRYFSWPGDDVRLLAIASEVPKGLRAPSADVRRHLEVLLDEEIRGKLDSLASTVGSAPVKHVTVGRPADEIMKFADEWRSDLVVKGADRPSGVRAPLFSSTDKKLVRRCPATVLLVRRATGRGRVVVALDWPERGEKNLEAAGLREALIRSALDMAQRLGTEEIVLIHAWSVVGLPLLEHPRSGLSASAVQSYVEEWEGEHRRWLDETVRNAGHRYGNAVRFIGHFVMGEAATVVPEAIRKLDPSLLVIGSANRTGLAGVFLGNTAEAVIDQVETDVLVVKPQSLETVVAPSR